MFFSAGKSATAPCPACMGPSQGKPSPHAGIMWDPTKDLVVFLTPKQGD